MVLLDMNDLVTPGWIPLAIVGFMAVCCVLLYLNMRKQIRRIDVPVDPQQIASAPFAKPEE